MRRRRGRGGTGVALAALGAVILVTIAAAWLDSRPGAASSALSRSREGWAGARRYLEARGTETALLDRSLADAAPVRGTLVLAFPWQRSGGEPSARELRRHLAAGGHLLVAYSGRRPGPGEEEVLDGLGFAPLPARPEPPLGPLAWRRHQREVWRLAPEERLAGELGPLVLPAADWVPDASGEARILYRTPQGRPAAFTVPRGGGQVAVVPAAALANARLALAGNPDLLETLARTLPAPWSFDELHHGLAGSGAVAAEAGQARVLDLVLAQLGLLYLAVVLTLSRRFGPPWREAPVVTGSTGTFFLGLGGLHHRLGHHAEGGRRLVERARALDPGLAEAAGMAALARRAEAGVDGAGLVALARELAALRSGARRAPAPERRPRG